MGSSDPLVDGWLTAFSPGGAGNWKVAGSQADFSFLIRPTSCLPTIRSEPAGHVGPLGVGQEHILDSVVGKRGIVLNIG
jgi:hypothetical protein